MKFYHPRRGKEKATQREKKLMSRFGRWIWGGFRVLFRWSKNDETKKHSSIEKLKKLKIEIKENQHLKKKSLLWRCRFPCYKRSVLQSFEVYLRTQVNLAEDDNKMVYKKFTSNFTSPKKPSGFYEAGYFYCFRK